MICVIALIVFGILGIFSATHRAVAKEAFDCVFRKITFRKCETRLDVRLKSQITGKIIKLSPKSAKFIYKHFEVISWIFLILFIVSFVNVAIGGYNYYLYGNCNGPQEEGFCIFDPLGSNSKVSNFNHSASCAADPPNPTFVTAGHIDTSLFPNYDRGADNEVIFVGCYGCPYTREAYPTIRKLLERDDVNSVFVHVPAKEKTGMMSNYLNCVYEIDKQKFIKLNDALFDIEVEKVTDENEILKLIEEVGLDKEAVKECSLSEEIINLTSSQISELEKTGIYGTPTVFVNGNAVVGPKPYRVYKRLLN